MFSPFDPFFRPAAYSSGKLFDYIKDKLSPQHQEMISNFFGQVEIFKKQCRWYAIKPWHWPTIALAIDGDPAAIAKIIIETGNGYVKARQKEKKKLEKKERKERERREKEERKMAGSSGSPSTGRGAAEPKPGVFSGLGAWYSNYRAQRAVRKEAKLREKTAKKEARLREKAAKEEAKLREKAAKEEEKLKEKGAKAQEKGASSSARKIAAGTASVAVAAGKLGVSAAKLGGRGIKGAAFGMGTIAAGTVAASGSYHFFFYIALLVHVIDTFTGFGKSNSGITGLRFGLYVFLLLYAWFALYGGATGGFGSIQKPAAISLICFLLPLLVSLLLKIPTSVNMQNTITAMLIFIPLWPIVVAFAIAPPNDKHMMIWRLIFILTWVIAALPTLYASVSVDLNFGESKIAVLNAIRWFFGLLKQNIIMIFTGIKTLPKVIMGGVQTQIQYATGDYYTGMVDDNQKEPIGVYLEDVKPASDKFYEDDSVTVWAVIRAKTMDPEKAININTACFAERDRLTTDASLEKSASYDYKDTLNSPTGHVSLKEGSAGFQVLGANANIDVDINLLKKEVVVGDADITGPESVFSMIVTVMEEKDLTCDFQQGELKEGTWSFYFVSTFNFDTYAYQKAYFMDQERMRAIRRQNKDPLDEYGVTDKTPQPVYTNGPIKVGMGITQPLTGLTRTGTNEMRLGLTIENQWQDRLGTIRKINDLVIKVPPSMSISFCDHNIKEEACKDAECEDGKYTSVYRLQAGSEGGKRGKDGMKNIETFQSINCRVSVDNVDAALGDSPISTQYFKVAVDYIYELRGTIPLTIEKSTLIP